MPKFTKGVCPNPNGRPKLSPEEREVREEKQAAAAERKEIQRLAAVNFLHELEQLSGEAINVICGMMQAEHAPGKPDWKTREIGTTIYLDRIHGKVADVTKSTLNGSLALRVEDNTPSIAVLLAQALPPQPATIEGKTDGDD